MTLVSTDIGGQMMLTNEIEIIWGSSLSRGLNWRKKMESHVRQYPVDFVTAGVSKYRSICQMVLSRYSLMERVFRERLLL